MKPDWLLPMKKHHRSRRVLTLFLNKRIPPKVSSHILKTTSRQVTGSAKSILPGDWWKKIRKTLPKSN
jgi:hypothetical protein